jgi:5'-methylthioadenosine phosphorylase
MAEMKVGLIGGSGLGEAIAATAAAEGVRHAVETPFGRPSDAILETRWDGVPVFFLARHGPGHTLGPSQVPFRANVFALKQLGVTHVIASGAVGSLREEFRPRDLVIPDQVIDKTFRRAGTFFENAAVHVELSEPFCPVLRRILMEAGVGRSSEVRVQSSGGEGGGGQPGEPALSETPTAGPELQTLNSELSAFTVHGRGCYVCMEGPAFSTRAESLMHRLWGGDLIGMTAMPEAKLAREAELSYALVALVTDYDCWRRPPAVTLASGSTAAGDGPGAAAAAVVAAPQDPYVLLEEIIANLRAASDNGVRLIRRAVQLMAGRGDELMAAPARSALKLAIWSDKSRVPREEVERLGPLWGRYFEGS